MDPVKDIKYLYDIIFKDKPECRYDGMPRLLPEKATVTRVIMMQEELNEYIEASENRDLEAILDALIDLMVFTVGAVYLHGLSDIFEEAWYRVQNANLKKFAGDKGRGSTCDMIKPNGWNPPMFGDLLK